MLEDVPHLSRTKLYLFDKDNHHQSREIGKLKRRILDYQFSMYWGNSRWHQVVIHQTGYLPEWSDSTPFLCPAARTSLIPILRTTSHVGTRNVACDPIDLRDRLIFFCQLVEGRFNPVGLTRTYRSLSIVGTLPSRIGGTRGGLLCARHWLDSDASEGILSNWCAGLM